MSEKYAEAFECLERMARVLEEDATKAAESRRMYWDPLESTLALRYGSIGRDIGQLGRLLREAFRQEVRANESLRAELAAQAEGERRGQR